MPSSCQMPPSPHWNFYCFKEDYLSIHQIWYIAEFCQFNYVYNIRNQKKHENLQWKHKLKIKTKKKNSKQYRNKIKNK